MADVLQSGFVNNEFSGAATPSNDMLPAVIHPADLSKHHLIAVAEKLAGPKGPRTLFLSTLNPFEDHKNEVFSPILADNIHSKFYLRTSADNVHTYTIQFTDALHGQSHSIYSALRALAATEGIRRIEHVAITADRAKIAIDLASPLQHACSIFYDFRPLGHKGDRANTSLGGFIQGLSFVPPTQFPRCVDVMVLRRHPDVPLIGHVDAKSRGGEVQASDVISFLRTFCPDNAVRLDISKIPGPEYEPRERQKVREGGPHGILGRFSLCRS